MAIGKVSETEGQVPMIRGELAFDSIRVYLGDTLHIDIRRSQYRALQGWKWEGNYIIEFILDGGVLKVEYTDEQRWKSVLDELKKLPLNGE